MFFKHLLWFSLSMTHSTNKEWTAPNSFFFPLALFLSLPFRLLAHRQGNRGMLASLNCKHLNFNSFFGGGGGKYILQWMLYDIKITCSTLLSKSQWFTDLNFVDIPCKTSTLLEPHTFFTFFDLSPSFCGHRGYKALSATINHQACYFSLGSAWRTPAPIGAVCRPWMPVVQSGWEAPMTKPLSPGSHSWWPLGLSWRILKNQPAQSPHPEILR